jgi:hypothetical protein
MNGYIKNLPAQSLFTVFFRVSSWLFTCSLRNDEFFISGRRTALVHPLASWLSLLFILTFWVLGSCLSAGGFWIPIRQRQVRRATEEERWGREQSWTGRMARAGLRKSKSWGDQQSLWALLVTGDDCNRITGRFSWTEDCTR